MKLIKFCFECGSNGDLFGLFAVGGIYEQQWNALVASDYVVEFGEVLGKHSEIQGPIAEADFHVVTDDRRRVRNLVEAYTGEDLESNDIYLTLSGYNPLDYMNATQLEGLLNDSSDN